MTIDARSSALANATRAVLRWPLPTSTSPDDPAFEPRRYWRGPTWPVINWLCWWASRRLGERDHAAALRLAALDQPLRHGLAEYFEPFTGEPLRALEQSWTAAFALDWRPSTDADWPEDARRPLSPEGTGENDDRRATG